MLKKISISIIAFLGLNIFAQTSNEDLDIVITKQKKELLSKTQVQFFNQDISKKNKPLIFKKKILPTCFVSLGLSSSLFSAISLKRRKDALDIYISSRNKVQIDRLKTIGKEETIKTIVFGSITLITIPIGIVQYIRNNKKINNKKLVSLTPTLNPETFGLYLSVTIFN